MGDHRASIEITFHLHGVTKKTNMYINWWDNGDGIDDRIVDFFREASQEAMFQYEVDLNAYTIQREEKENEIKDLQEYERLKKKYQGFNT